MLGRAVLIDAPSVIDAVGRRARDGVRESLLKPFEDVVDPGLEGLDTHGAQGPFNEAFQCRPDHLADLVGDLSGAEAREDGTEVRELHPT